MALNLSRNTKVYFTTNIAASTNVVNSSGFTNANTFEIQVMDGYKFNQSTNQQTIQPKEAGAVPLRGQRSFNTELAPVDWNITTYIRPQLVSNKVTSSERHLWNAMMGPSAINGNTITAVSSLTRASTTTGVCTATGAAGFGTQFVANTDYINISGGSGNFDGMFLVTSSTSTTAIFTNPYLTTADLATATGTIIAGEGQWFESTAYARASMANSNVNALQPFGLVFKVDNTYYAVDNCAVEKATVDFGLDAIGMIAWDGKGTAVRDLELTGTAGGLTTITGASTTAGFITNKLSTMTLTQGIGSTGTAYSVALTGGNFSIANNLQYLTPAILGIVNKPIGYAIGTRAVTGSLTAYLKTGTNESSTLLKDILTGANSSTENFYETNIHVGGASNTVRMSLSVPACMLQVPTVDIADVVSTTINFTAQGYDILGSTNAASGYNISNANEATVKYYGIA